MACFRTLARIQLACSTRAGNILCNGLKCVSNRSTCKLRCSTDLRNCFGRPNNCSCSALVVRKVYGMFARHALHGLRILVSCAPELRSRYLSSKLPWLYEGRSMQITSFGVLRFDTCVNYALAVSRRPRRIHCSAVMLSHYRPEPQCTTTCGNDTVAEFLTTNSSNLCPTGVPFTRWLHIAWFYAGSTRGSHKCGFQSMAGRPSSQRVSDRDTAFLENLRLCREYVPQR